MDKLKKHTTIAAAALAVSLLGASAASSATFNFVSMADNAADANYIGSKELNWADTSFSGGLTIGGITLVASGSNANNPFADAFFDKGKAGLGVCSTVMDESDVAPFCETLEKGVRDLRDREASAA